MLLEPPGAIKIQKSAGTIASRVRALALPVTGGPDY